MFYILLLGNTNDIVSSELHFILSIFVAINVHASFTKSVKKIAYKNSKRRGGVHSFLNNVQENLELVLWAIPKWDSHWFCCFSRSLVWGIWHPVSHDLNGLALTTQLSQDVLHTHWTDHIVRIPVLDLGSAQSILLGLYHSQSDSEDSCLCGSCEFLR